MAISLLFPFSTTFSFERLLKHLKKHEHQPHHHPIYDTILSWVIALLCFIYYGYRYALMQYQQRQKQHLSVSSPPHRRGLVPLMTHSRTEQDRHTLVERVQQLQNYLKKRNGTANNDRQADWSDDELISCLRSQEVPRRLASLIILLLRQQQPNDQMEETTTPSLQEDDLLLQQQQQSLLIQQLLRIWPSLLPLPHVPSAENTDDNNNDNNNDPSRKNFSIALILPAYRECGSKIQRVLRKALLACHSPQHVQVIIVDAGGNIDLSDAFAPSCELKQQQQQSSSSQSSSTTTATKAWGQCEILTFSDGGGRGPCLNYGARHASHAQLYTFLHSDTTLPHHWDQFVKQALLLLPSHRRHDNDDDDNNGRPIVINHACAFSFGIDTTPQGLDGGCYPYGIQSIHSFLGNLRASIFKLPYGDHVISIAASTFWYVGGYPDQPIMEDYELMHLLRQRSTFLLYRNEEQLAILPSRAYCSPRRWQRLGVPYVTLANAYCVYQYECGMTPDDLYRYYYHQPPPQRKSDQSPWEMEMLKQQEQQVSLPSEAHANG